jgi:MFS family permease
MTSGEFRKRQLVTSIYLPSLLITAAEGALLPILPVSAVGFGFSLAEASIVTTVLMVSTMVFEVPASWLNSKIGERQAMIASAVLGFATTMLAFFHLGYPALVLSALGFGAAHSLFGLARHSLLAEIVPEQHRPKSMSLLGGMFRGGMAIGPVLGSAFIVLYGVEFGYLAAAILCLASGGRLPDEKLRN